MTMTTHVPISYSMSGAVSASGLSRSTLERAIRAGVLRAHKSDRDADGNPCGVWVIKADSLRSYIDSLPEAG